MTVQGLDHVSLTVHDLDRSVRFYRDLLGIPLLGRGEESGTPATKIGGSVVRQFLYADLDLGGGRVLELLHYPDSGTTSRGPRPRDHGGGHFGLLVDDLDAELAKLASAGVSPNAPPVVLDSPPWWAGARCVYVTDPDGLTVELIQRPLRR